MVFLIRMTLQYLCLALMTRLFEFGKWKLVSASELLRATPDQFVQ